MLNRILNIVIIAAVPLFTLAATGCSGNATGEPVVTAQSGATKAPVAQNAHGPVKLVGNALGEVALRPAQRTEIEKLATDTEARHQAGSGVRKDLMEAIALQVEAGKIDRAALQPKIDAVAAAWDASRGADRAAFERLHDILDSEQRAAFVTAFQAQMGEMKSHHKGGGDHKAGGHKGGFGGMQEWATDLKLTDAQKTQIHDAMKARFQAMHQSGDKTHGDKHAGGRDFGKNVLEAFKGDKFVMDTVAPKQDAKAGANKMADKMVGMVEVVVPILTAEQRTIAAAKIRTRATNSTIQSF